MGLLDRFTGKKRDKSSGMEVKGKMIMSADGYPICPICGRKSPASREQLMAQKTASEREGEHYDVLVIGCVGCGSFLEL